MSGSSPLLIVSLPASGVHQARSMALAAQRGGADLAEVRFDRFPAGELSQAGELFPSPIPLVATVRSRAEGGDGPSDRRERLPMLRALEKLPFAYVDRELRRDFPLDGVDSAAHPPWIASVHLPSGSAGTALSGVLHEPHSQAEWTKVVVPATLTEFWRDVWPEVSSGRPPSTIVLTTGPSGPLLRAWSGRLGYPAVFAALPATEQGAPAAAVEASQLPVDRLRPYLRGVGSPPMFAVVGDPVEQSRSPALHSAWMRADGRVGIYVALKIQSEREFGESIPALAEGGFRGLNVTHPWKLVALRHATDASPGARAVGSANTLTFEGDRVYAENTDLGAMRRRLEELRRADRWDGRETTVLGTGGAARAAVLAASSLGAVVTVLGRHRVAAQALAQEFGPKVRSPEGDPEATGLLIHATSAGMDGSGSLSVALPPLLRATSYVLDLQYGNHGSELARAAEAASAVYEDGQRLLEYQAAESYALWWGSPPGSRNVSIATEVPS